MSNQFSQLPLTPALLEALDNQQFKTMTEIQQKALPDILSEKDVLGQAKTGSGKTLTFALGLLQKTDTSSFGVQSLVLCPTRELAEQVAEEIRKLGKRMPNLKVLTLYGGTAIGPQIQSLQHSAHVIVGTPGRIMDLIDKGHLNLWHVKTLVLDEADRMLDMGFEEEMTTVIREVPQERQTLLFSATFPESIKRISQDIQRSPVEVTVTTTHDNKKIEQTFFEVQKEHKTKATAAVLSEYQPESCIIFCNTKVACQELADDLREMGFSAIALHGDLEQKERNQVIARFSNQSELIMVATDVASRGLDIDGVSLVINYQVAMESEAHIHRIGRTGRADSEGVAVTLAAPEEIHFVRAIEELQQQKAKWKGIQALRFHANRIIEPKYQTVAIDAGKKNKLRPGDILGALTQDADIPGDDIGKIKITATHSFVAVKVRSVKRTLNYFKEGKIKGRRCKARRLA
ncbi:ATP-dependent RNA helicase DbpA [Planctobacterium marinum]|uniref:ATP-dependent RNA helicase n=1 Tax=Planctobacterium marinum TaxID=1631968 RepID=A0AA48HI67_9ALTE|nr:ATP-dependent RNA helicase [Planctobacterium marinum]